MDLLAAWLVIDNKTITREVFEIRPDTVSVWTAFYVGNATTGEDDLGSIRLLAEDWREED